MPAELARRRQPLALKKGSAFAKRGLLADAQLGNDSAVALDVDLGQVVEEAAALADHLDRKSVV